MNLVHGRIEFALSTKLFSVLSDTSSMHGQIEWPLGMKHFSVLSTRSIRIGDQNVQICTTYVNKLGINKL